MNMDDNRSQARDTASPRVLMVDTSLSGEARLGPVWDGVIGYEAVRKSPGWVRSCEQYARLDFSLARRALRELRQFDLLLAGSEKVGIPLALMRPQRPIVCLVHQIASPHKRALLKWLGVTSRWTRIGYQCEADRELLAGYYGVPAGRLIKFKEAPLTTFSPSSSHGDYLLSVGVTARDYQTLIASLQLLPEVITRVYASSRYLNQYHGGVRYSTHPGTELRGHVEAEVMPQVYQAAKFVVLPLHDTYQYSAGATVALEAHAAGKAVVATNTRGMRDFVVHGVTGLLVPPGDVRAMKEAIGRLWRDPALTTQMGLAGRAHVEREFNPVHIFARIREMYTEIWKEYCRSR